MARRKPAYITEDPCPSCPNGTLKPLKLQHHHTRVKGFPFVVPEAWFSACDTCGERLLHAKELAYWTRLFFDGQKDQEAWLTPEQIIALRQSIGLGPLDFARLIGASKASIWHWEKTKRDTPPNRTADLLMQLVHLSRDQGPVDVIEFLLEEAEKWGYAIELEREAAG